MSYKWIPNAVSMLRGILALILFLCALQHYWLAAALIAVLAFATDALDGWLAHWLNAQSDLGGKFIDPANDTLFSIALIAGLFFTGIINWPVIWFLVAVTVVIWAPIILIKDKRLKTRFTDISRSYYVAIAVLFTGIYFYFAIGNTAAWLLIPALPLGFWAAHIRDKRPNGIN